MQYQRFAGLDIAAFRIAGLCQELTRPIGIVGQADPRRVALNPEGTFAYVATSGGVAAVNAAATCRTWCRMAMVGYAWTLPFPHAA